MTQSARAHRKNFSSMVQLWQRQSCWSMHSVLQYITTCALNWHHLVSSHTGHLWLTPSFLYNIDVPDLRKDTLDKCLLSRHSRGCMSPPCSYSTMDPCIKGCTHCLDTPCQLQFASTVTCNWSTWMETTLRVFALSSCFDSMMRVTDVACLLAGRNCFHALCSSLKLPP